MVLNNFSIYWNNRYKVNEWEKQLEIRKKYSEVISRKKTPEEHASIDNMHSDYH